MVVSKTAPPGRAGQRRHRTEGHHANHVQLNAGSGRVVPTGIDVVLAIAKPAQIALMERTTRTDRQICTRQLALADDRRLR